jgi:hypothetical protein
MRYALRKRDQKWTVCLEDRQLLAFDDFEEAFLVAWNAALIIERSKDRSLPEDTVSLIAQDQLRKSI